MAERFAVVPAAYVFLLREGTVLLLRRHGTGFEDGNYGLPAGHLDGEALRALVPGSPFKPNLMLNVLVGLILGLVIGGLAAFILEQLEDNRLFRPLSEYVGEPVGKTVVPVDQR